jgi:hypothetical protein
MEYIQSTKPRKVHGLVVASYGCEWGWRVLPMQLQQAGCRPRL